MGFLKDKIAVPLFGFIKRLGLDLYEADQYPKVSYQTSKIGLKPSETILISILQMILLYILNIQQCLQSLVAAFLVISGILPNFVAKIVGFVYPTYRSFYILEKGQKNEIQEQWLVYWIVFGVVGVLEAVGGILLKFLNYFFRIIHTLSCNLLYVEALFNYIFFNIFLKIAYIARYIPIKKLNFVEQSISQIIGNLRFFFFYKLMLIRQKIPHILKIFVFIYLFDPKRKGAQKLYYMTLRKYFLKNEKTFDAELNNLEKGIEKCVNSQMSQQFIENSMSYKIEKE